MAEARSEYRQDFPSGTPELLRFLRRLAARPLTPCADPGCALLQRQLIRIERTSARGSAGHASATSVSIAEWPRIVGYLSVLNGQAACQGNPKRQRGPHAVAWLSEPGSSTLQKARLREPGYDMKDHAGDSA